MFATQFADLTSGYERFDALKKNLEGIFDKINQMKKYKLDISYYEEKLEEFKREFKLKDDFLQSSKMPFESMQKDYEAFTLTECNKKLEKLTQEFEDNVTPIYNIYLLFRTIDEKLNDKNDDDINDVIKQTILLIDQINGIYTHNKIEVTRLVERAYETIYNALLYEEVYGRTELLEYLKKKNLSSNRENLGKVIREKTKKLLENGSLKRTEVDEELIEHLDEGLGYDYLSSEFLSTMSRKSLASKQERVNYRNQQMNAYMTGVIENENSNYTSLVSELEDTKKEVGKLRRTRALTATKAASIILVPMMCLAIGLGAGRLASNKIDEYATITRNVNIETGAVVGEPSIVYDEHSTTYVATITIYEPWRKNPTGVGYVRNATAYEYILPEDVGEDYHVTIEDIEGNVREKYKFIEPKDKLTNEDSMTDSEIIVTETYQDKTNTQKSSKYVIPFGLAGFGISTAAIIAFMLLKGVSLSDIHDENYESYIDLKNGKKRREEVKKRLLELRSRVQSINEDKKKIEEEYGIQVDANLVFDSGEQKKTR